MSIKIKLAVTLTALTLVIATLGVSAFFALQTVNANIASIVADRVVPLQQLKRIADAYAVAIVDNAHKVRVGAVSWEEGLSIQRNSLVAIEKDWTSYLAMALNAEEARLVETAKANMAEATASLADLDTILSTRNQAALENYIWIRLYPAIDPVSGSIGALVDLQGRIAVEVYGDSKTLFNNIMLVFAGLVAVATLTIGYAAFVVLRTVSARLQAMETSLSNVAAGDFASAIPSAGDRDEIGRIATAAETFRQNGTKVAQMTQAEQARALADIETRRAMMADLRDAFGSVVDAAIAGDFSRRVPRTFADPELNGLAASVNDLVETVDRGLAETGTVLSALAETNLTQRVTGQFAGAFGHLKHDVNAVADRLSDIVAQLRETSGSVKTATGEILSGANDLAERTTRQAAAIEETSAAMEQLAGTVVENAERADAANTRSRSVAAGAEATGTVMTEANQAMQRIADSSGKISNIIGLIDDIAFQTNLLALNASVEAARAGEAGKGFAAVAVEVRRLAQSAAEASAEVKALIDQSASQVSTGSRLVADATTRIEAMIAGVRDNVALIDAIATASRDQSAAITEVSAAVRQMDEMTQHNAALVEETNAAIEQTEAQANELDRIVDIFVIAERPTAHPAALSRPRPTLADNALRRTGT